MGEVESEQIPKVSVGCMVWVVIISLPACYIILKIHTDKCNTVHFDQLLTSLKSFWENQELRESREN